MAKKEDKLHGNAPSTSDEWPEDTRNITSVDELPDDPLSMPPPYWRGTSSTFHVVDSLKALPQQLKKLVSVNDKTARKLRAYFRKYPEENPSEKAQQEFSNICGELWELEHNIKLKCEIAILMSAISAEDDLNQFCVFNLPKTVAEPIEKLPMTEKLLIACSWVSKEMSKKVKSDAVFEAISKLTTWRNAFAHGHCVDRPLKSLRHNHLISPAEYPAVPSSLLDTVKLVKHFVRVAKFLNQISINRFTAMPSAEIFEIEGYLREIGRYRFEGSNDVYRVTYSGKVVRQ
jgi:hypothetical protein